MFFLNCNDELIKFSEFTGTWYYDSCSITHVDKQTRPCIENLSDITIKITADSSLEFYHQNNDTIVVNKGKISAFSIENDTILIHEQWLNMSYGVIAKATGTKDSLKYIIEFTNAADPKRYGIMENAVIKRLKK